PDHLGVQVEGVAGGLPVGHLQRGRSWRVAHALLLRARAVVAPGTWDGWGSPRGSAAAAGSPPPTPPAAGPLPTPPPHPTVRPAADPRRQVPPRHRAGRRRRAVPDRPARRPPRLATQPDVVPDRGRLRRLPLVPSRAGPHRVGGGEELDVGTGLRGGTDRAE